MRRRKVVDVTIVVEEKVQKSKDSCPKERKRRRIASFEVEEVKDEAKDHFVAVSFLPDTVAIEDSVP